MFGFSYTAVVGAVTILGVMMEHNSYEPITITTVINRDIVVIIGS